MAPRRRDPPIPLRPEAGLRRENLARLLAPRHVAFIGGKAAADALARCEQFGFEGELWQVNPRASAADGKRVFASSADLPCAPDAAYLAISADKSVDAVRELATRRAGGVVCYAAGFAEKGGEGVALQERLAEAAGDLALIGPNCLGLLDYRVGLHLWAGDVQERFAGPGIGLVSQSGALVEFMTMHRRSIPFVSVVSVGNQAVLSLEDVTEAMLDDPGVKAIGLYIEGLRDVAHFSRVAAKALSKRVPLVAIKVGRSEIAARLALGHTSSLAGASELYDALFERLGILVVDSLGDMLETLKLLSVIGPLPGRRFAAITGSGGQAAMIADHAAGLGLTLPPLSQRQVERLRAGLPDYVNLINPLDMTVGTMGNLEQQRLLFDVLAEGDIDVLVAGFDAYDDIDAAFGAEVMMSFEQMAAALGRHQRLGIATSALPETLPAHIRERALEVGIAPLQGSRETLTAMAGAAWYGERQHALQDLDVDTLSLPPPPIQAGPVAALDEAQAKRLLGAAGLVIPEGRCVTPAKAVDAANALGFPVVVKVLDATLPHKSEAGAVALDLRDANSVSAAVERMQGALAAPPERLLVEKMIPDAVAELIVGIEYDEAFGHALVIGAGGILVELLRDSATVLLPTTRACIEDALDRLDVARLLAGFRGRPRGDRTAVITAIEAIADFTLSERDRIVEIDVNPLLVLPEGRGAVAADALVRLRETD